MNTIEQLHAMRHRAFASRREVARRLGVSKREAMRRGINWLKIFKINQLIRKQTEPVFPRRRLLELEPEETT